MEISRKNYSKQTAPASFKHDHSLLLTVTLSALLLALVMHLLVFAKDVMVPVVFSFFLSVLLYKPLLILEKLRLPRAFAALLLVCLVLFIFLAGGYSMKENAQDLLRALPQVIEKIRHQTFAVEQAIEDVQQRTTEVENAISEVMENNTSKSQKVIVAKDISLQDRIVKEGIRVLWLTSVTFLLGYFFLVGGDVLIRNIAFMVDSRAKRIEVFRLFRSIRQHLANFIGVTLMVNLGYGLAIGLLLYYLNIELAFLWGLGAGMLRYVPFIGTIITMAVIIVVAVTYQNDMKMVLLIPCAVLALNFITGNLIDPLVHSQRFQLNPIAIFIAIVFWGWIWGAPGLFIALPSLITMAVVCQSIPSLTKVYLTICTTSGLSPR